MFYLFLAVLVQTWNAALLKIGELYRQERLVVMGFNYITASLGAAMLWAWQGTGMPGTVTLVLGPVGGFFWATSLFLWMGAMARVGLATSTAAMRLSVIWPTLISLTIFGEMPHLLQWGGIALTLLVLLLLGIISFRTRGSHIGEGGILWLFGMFALMGGVGITQKFFIEWGRPEDKSALLTLVFFTAGLMCWGAIGVGRLRLRRSDALRGFVFGLGNVSGNFFTLLALEDVPGVVAFPVLSIGVILLASLSGILLWKERPGRLGLLAILLSAVAIFLMAR